MRCSALIACCGTAWNCPNGPNHMLAQIGWFVKRIRWIRWRPQTEQWLGKIQKTWADVNSVQGCEQLQEVLCKVQFAILHCNCRQIMNLGSWERPAKLHLIDLALRLKSENASAQWNYGGTIVNNMFSVNLHMYLLSTEHGGYRLRQVWNAGLGWPKVCRRFIF